MSSVMRHLAAAAALALALFAIVAERTREQGTLWMHDSDRAFDAGRLDLALQHARAAATAYVPGAEHVSLGYARLRALARGAERARDVERAAAAWRAVRSAAIESRHLWQPHPDELREADRELARLTGAKNASSAGDSSEGDTGLSGLPAAVLCGLVLGAASALFGLFGLFGVGPGQDGRSPRVALPALLCIVGVACWSFALLHA